MARIMVIDDHGLLGRRSVARWRLPATTWSRPATACVGRNCWQRGVRIW